MINNNSNKKLDNYNKHICTILYVVDHNFLNRNCDYFLRTSNIIKYMNNFNFIIALNPFLTTTKKYIDNKIKLINNIFFVKYDKFHINKLIQCYDIHTFIITSNYINFTLFYNSIHYTREKSILIYDMRYTNFNRTISKKNRSIETAEYNIIKIVDGVIYSSNELYDQCIRNPTIKNIRSIIVFNGYCDNIVLNKNTNKSKFIIGYYKHFDNTKYISELRDIVCYLNNIIKEINIVICPISFENNYKYDVDIYYSIYPFKYETQYPNSIMLYTALYYRIPILSHYNDFTISLSNNGNNFIVTKYDYRSLKYTFHNIIKNGYDNTIIHNGYNLTKIHNWKIQGIKCNDFILSIINNISHSIYNLNNKQSDNKSISKQFNFIHNNDNRMNKYTILYVVCDISLYTKCGYTIRTDYIVKNIKNIDIYVTLNPFVIDNNIYTSKNKIIKQNNIQYILYDYIHLDHFIESKNIKYIIIVSDNNNYLSFVDNFKHRNIKYIYDIRGLWYLSREAIDRHHRELFLTHKYIHQQKKREILVANKCDGYVFISDEIKNYYIDKLGITNINYKPNIIIPNGIDVQNIEMYIKIKNNTTFTIGYFGTISEYEGINMLINVVGDIYKNNKNILLYLIGKNKMKLDIHKPFIKYVEWMEPHKLKLEYNKLDLYCLPRLPYVICEIVAPLKLFESMYHKIPLLMSDCECLKNISENGKYCMLFEKGNKDSLKKNILNIINNGYNKQLLIDGYNFVVSSRNWIDICYKYETFIFDFINSA